MKPIINIITIVFFILSCSVTYTMEQKPGLVKIQIQDKMYELTLKQAQQSEKLQEILKKHTDVEEPIILPYSIAPEVFDYIYKDLQGVEFDSSLLDDKMIGDLYNAAFDLKIPWLQEKYTDITVDRITDITLEVGDKKYILTAEQAKKSKTLKNILSDVEDYTVPIPLPETLENIFEYIYDDLTHKEYDSNALNIETLVDLVNAANYLDALQLLQRYQNLLIERLTYVDEKHFEEYINLLQKLPEEMQEPLSQLICAKALEVFKKLPQSEIKRVPEVNYSFNDLKKSPDKTKMITQKDDDFQCIDLISNKILWKKELKDWYSFDTILFSFDGSKFLLCSKSTLFVYNTNDGEEVLKKDFSSHVYPMGFFSSANKIVLRDVQKKLLVIDAESGELSFEKQFSSKPPGETIDKCSYDSDSEVLCIKIESSQNYILVVDIKTGIIIKRKSDTESEKYDIFPNGKKIIRLSKELVSVENSFNEEGNFSWAFKKTLSKIPKLSSFSNDAKLFAICSIKDSKVFVLNSVTGETVWARSNLKIKSTFFSHDIHWFVINGLSSILGVNLDLKKEAWIEKYPNGIRKIYDISNDFIMFSLKGKTIRSFSGDIKIADIKTGHIISELSSKENDLLQFRNLLNNNLFASFHSQGLWHMICYNISPLHIIAFLNQSYIPLDQALLIYYIFKMIENDERVLIPSTLEFIYDELPQKIKKLEKDHNRKFIEDASKEDPAALKKFKRIKIE